MNAMDKLFKLLLAAAAALFFTGCYSDYLNPGPARVYTRADFEAKGLEYISVGELKARFRAENAGMNDHLTRLQIATETIARTRRRE